MARYIVEDTKLTAIADAIRNKTELNELITLSAMPAMIDACYSASEYDNLVSQYSTLEDSYDTLNVKHTTLESEYSTLKTQYNNLISENENLSSQLNSAQQLANDRLSEINSLQTSWASSLTFTGNYASSTYYTASGCSLAVDKITGMAFITIQGGTSTSYENIYFTNHSLPQGVTALTTQKYGGPTGGTAKMYFTQVLTGITGKIKVVCNLSAVNGSYDYVQASLTVTYV